MKFIEPRAYYLAATAVDNDGMHDYLEAVGAHRLQRFDEGLGLRESDSDDEIDLWETDAPSGGEELVEVAGRSCYRSFRPGLNPNVRLKRAVELVGDG